jgi:hypothetical protein
MMLVVHQAYLAKSRVSSEQGKSIHFSHTTATREHPGNLRASIPPYPPPTAGRRRRRRLIFQRDPM